MRTVNPLSMIPKDAAIRLSPEDIPKKWYNLMADLPKKPAPPMNPHTGKPTTYEDLSPLFCDSILKQEASTERYIRIPEKVRENLIYLNRPEPLQRAYRLEKYLKTSAKIYFKREDMSPLGSHKGNTALAQAYYNMKDGIENLTTETGAGQWGTALAMSCNLFDIGCTVFMVRGSYDQKPARKTLMNMYNATVHASPSNQTEYGRKVLETMPNTVGSLGIAISEACDMAMHRKDTKYALGSVLNHVMLHQTVIGLETMQQMEIGEIEPDCMIACAGGGSNFAGFAFPMIGRRIKGKTDCEFLAAESDAAPSMTAGKYGYDLGDTGGFTPELMMHTMGHDFIPSPVHAGGLRYHGMAPLVSAALDQGFMTARSYGQPETFRAGKIFAETEGIIAAPESCHAIQAAIEKALEYKAAKEEKTIVFCLSGHGLLDLYGYEKYLSGKLEESAV